MASKTLLLNLPNELFSFIFQYLSSIDVLKAFFDINSCRIQALIQPFITRLDISQESDEWIQTNLTDIFTRYNIIDLRVKLKHLAFISEDLLSTGIQSMQVINWDYDFDLSEKIFSQLRRNLKRLLLSFPEMGESEDLLHHLFQPDSQLEHLTIEHSMLGFYNQQFETYTRLTYLSVELEAIQLAFIFIEHLPNIQQLKVKIRSQECFGQPEPDINGVKPCNTLRSVTFTGWIKYFDHLESFFTAFGSTIKYVLLNILLMYRIVDGKKLEHGLLDKMPNLSSFNLIILSAAADGDPIEIETFQSFTWQQFNPVVYWYDVHAAQHTIFTLPYKSNEFKYLSNDCLSTCVSNQPVSLNFKRVRTLSLTITTPLTLETFYFIRKVFPNVTTVELTDWITDFWAENGDEDDDDDEDEDEDKDEEDRSAISMSEDLLLDTSLEIPSVTRFYVDMTSRYIDWKAFCRFLRLFPKLVDLKLDVQQSFVYDILKYKNEDKLVEIAMAHIEKVEINVDDAKETQIDAEMHELFPKAKHLIIEYNKNRA